MKLNQHSKQGVNLILGDCLEKMKDIPDNSVDSIVTDPPYGLSFMGKKWDCDVPSKEIWQEALRVLKPGGHLLAFAGTRTQHRMAVNIEDAGFEIRDMIAWVYGSGFPKSHNVGKAVKAQRETGGSAPKNLRQNRMGADYQPTGQKDYRKGRMFSSEIEHDGRVEEVNNGWSGWGTALKPSLEPITLARKPLSEKSVALNCLKWGVGGINIDGSRVEGEGYSYPNGCGGSYGSGEIYGTASDEMRKEPYKSNNLGRFPANLIHDGSDEVLAVFPNCKQAKNVGDFKQLEEMRFSAGGVGVKKQKQTNGEIIVASAARFFYCAKASKKERNMGLEGFEEKLMARSGGAQQAEKQGQDEYLQSHIGLNRISKVKNNHPTVKPVKLMQYLVRLITPPGGIVLDPFMGSGTTGVACKNLNRSFIGIELDPEYFEIAKSRIENTPDRLANEVGKLAGVDVSNLKIKK